MFERLGEAALGALDDYMAFRAYQGSNPDYYRRARLGIPVLSTYGRVRGTRANERQLQMLERRIASGEVLPAEALALSGESVATSDGAAEGARKGRRERN